MKVLVNKSLPELEKVTKNCEALLLKLPELPQEQKILISQVSTTATAARRGANRAAVAVAHSILIIVYHILKQKQPYIELGPTYYEEKKRNMIIRQSLKKLESLGLKVTVESAAS
jgi:uncharacterized paraquat-inducible protein A